MSVRLRLKRMGRKKRPFYRIVATDKRAPRDGRHIEVLGHYNPMAKPSEISVNLERVDYWLGVGASPSDTVAFLIHRARNGAPEGEAAADAKAPPLDEDEQADNDSDADADADAGGGDDGGGDGEAE